MFNVRRAKHARPSPRKDGRPSRNHDLGDSFYDLGDRIFCLGDRKNSLGDRIFCLGDRKISRPNRKGYRRGTIKGPREGPILL